MFEDYSFFTVFMLSMVVACLSWTVSKSELFSSVRAIITNYTAFFGKAVNCPYCVSHYFAACVSLYCSTHGFYDLLFLPKLVSWFALTLILVWLSAFQWSLLALLWRRLSQ